MATTSVRLAALLVVVTCLTGSVTGVRQTNAMRPSKHCLQKSSLALNCEWLLAYP